MARLARGGAGPAVRSGIDGAVCFFILSLAAVGIS
jgi:hypothetical protein